MPVGHREEETLSLQSAVTQRSHPGQWKSVGSQTGWEMWLYFATLVNAVTEALVSWKVSSHHQLRKLNGSASNAINTWISLEPSLKCVKFANFQYTLDTTLLSGNAALIIFGSTPLVRVPTSSRQWRVCKVKVGYFPFQGYDQSLSQTAQQNDNLNDKWSTSNGNNCPRKHTCKLRWNRFANAKISRKAETH